MRIPRGRPLRTIAAGAALASMTGGAFAAAPPKIPLCAGLTIVTAIAEPEGDYESIKTISGIDATAIHMRYSSELVMREMAGHPIERVKVARTIRIEDLRTATRYLQVFGSSTPPDVPGTTSLGTSADVLRRLKETGTAELAIFDMPAGLPSEKPYATDRGAHPNIFDHEVPFTLHRVESAPVMIPVTINGEKVGLPAIHATATAEWGEKGEFFFLDDETNPLSLRWGLHTNNLRVNDRHTLQVVKISYNCSRGTGPTPLETALAERGRADLYEIFFTFNSDEIREESEPTLAEIADILGRHVDWKLGIAGHTDGIASDGFNLGLSKRRAAAVKSALMARYHIEAARLTTAGYGKSMPKDTNATPEGRARNRRVELVRR